MVLPCLMTALNSIGGSCFGWAGGRIQTEATLLFSYADNLVNLGKQVQDLGDAIKSLDDRIRDAANNRGATVVDAVVVRLLERMISLKEEASKIISDEERSSDSTCLMGLRTNLWACYLTSKSARKAIDEALELLEKEKTLDRVIANVDYSNFLGVTPIEDFEEFQSRVLVSKKIVAALDDSNVNKVGIYGMGGTGKTSLAEKIGAELQLNGTVNFVVLATVSEKQNQRDNDYKPDLSNIQEQIAGGFKIQLEGKTLKDRTVELREQLQKKDKVLIILDDIWSGFELKDVGIPTAIDKKFKILMTSRSEAVLLKAMNSESNFGLDSLPDPDAWTLFDRMVGGHIQYSNWRPTAEQVVKQCGGIPIILVTIAKALRNEASESWEDALSQLKQFDGEDIVEEPYKMIEVSYKFLISEEKKKLLLLCAQLNHRSIAKDYLLKYAMGLNLFKGCKTLKEVRNRLHKYLSDLKGCCLLQDGNEEGMIKMHDVIHKFASYVAFRDHNVFSVANDGEIQVWPSKNELEHFSAISLPSCDLPPSQMLPVAFDNPKLESFIMYRREIDASFQIPDKFFAGMKGLKVMDLTRVSLSSVLVSSLSALVQLQTLCLDFCELSDISVIGELPILKALSLFGSSMVLVPKEIGKLGSTLKLLDLRRCEKLERIAAGVIFRLTLLEDLRIGESYKHWELLEGNHKRSNIVDETNEAEMASMEEFKNLQNLINLEIHILDHGKMFPKDLFLTKLVTFKILFGNSYWKHDDYISTRTVKIAEYGTVFDYDSEATKALMEKAETFLVKSLDSSVNVSEMHPKGLTELKHLKVEHADEIQYIVAKNGSNCIFPKLEVLIIYDLGKLERIWDDKYHPLPIGSFENLRSISVRLCHTMKDLLSSNLANGLLCLQEMSVTQCESMKSIIGSTESENEEEIEIGLTHQLRVLKLSYLYCLVNFYHFKQSEVLPSPTTHLFNKKIIFSKLEVLELKGMENEKIWDDHLAITAEGICSFQNLTRLEVGSCDNLSYLFTSSIVKSFTQLKYLKVCVCESIEEIVAIREKGMEEERLLLFPKLESLLLNGLPKLKRFCHANLLEWQSLQKLEIWECPMMNAFSNGNGSSLFDEKILFPKLEELFLRNMKIEKIWSVDHLTIAAEETTCRFQNLTSLHVWLCENLSYMFTTSMVKSLPQLKQLLVRECKSVEEIVSSTERGTTRDIQLSFPKLDNIELKSLPNLKRFCEVNLLECPLLQRLSIGDCLDLKTFISVTGSSSSNHSTNLLMEKVAFPNLKELQIYKCPSLVPRTLESLEPLQVQNCDKIDLFGFNNTQQLNDAFAKRISSFEYCDLSIGGLVLRYENQRVTLETVGCDFQLPRILFTFLKSFTKLHKVEVSGYPLITQLFPLELDHMTATAGHDMDSQAKTLARMGELALYNLSKMKQIWSEHSPPKYHVMPEVLYVIQCDNLISLAPPSPTLLKNLTVLRVRRCPLLIRLVASSSTAKSLVNLEELVVESCDSLEEIVGIDDQRDELASNNAEYIVFEKLEALDLQDLNSLTSFCSTSDCNFRFPSLNRVTVENCPKMKFFYEGGLSTPNLIRVWPIWVKRKYEEREQNQARWAGDLNSTVRQLFEEKLTAKIEEKDENRVEDNL